MKLAETFMTAVKKSDTKIFTANSAIRAGWSTQGSHQLGQIRNSDFILGSQTVHPGQELCRVCQLGLILAQSTGGLN
jgi:hypothetical protein